MGSLKDELEGKRPDVPHPERMTRRERAELRLEMRKSRRNEREAGRFLRRLLSYFLCGVLGAILGGAVVAIPARTDVRLMLFAFPVAAVLAGILTAYLLSIWWMSPEGDQNPREEQPGAGQPGGVAA